MATAIEFQNVGKMYRLGRVGTGTLSHDLNRWWQMSVLGKEDPYLKIGQTNDRTTKGDSDYVWALRDISFKVEQGEVLGIIGKNGAGKSTLLKLLSNITSPSTGSIKYRGRIASLLEVGTGFHPEMTGRENIYMNGSIMGMTKQEITRKLDEIVDFAGVERYLDTPVKRYSSGMTVRLGFAVAAFLEPEILVVDEVLTVGDAEFQKKAIGKMNDVAHEGGRTVLFVSHNMAAVRSLCTRGVVLQNGTQVFDGSALDAVDFYVSNNIQELKRKTIKESLLRKFATSKDVEVESAEMINKNLKVATNEPLSFSLTLKKNRDVKNLSVEIMIDNERDERVGSYISKIHDISNLDNKFEVSLTLRDHNLAKGKYKVNFNVGLKDVESGLKDYDVVYETVFFEVDKSDYITGTPIMLWRNGWGNCNFQNADISFRPLS